MAPYLVTFRLAAQLAQNHLRLFPISPASRFRYAIKSGTLAACFLGFSARSGEESYRRSAEVGVLASLFDLISDGLCYDPHSRSLFDSVVESTVEGGTREIILGLMERKHQGKLEVLGLERGVDALQIIIRHLDVQEYWKSFSEVYETGILCQIVDDVLDYKNDLKWSELSFLRHPDRDKYIRKLLDWDYRHQLRYSAHPFVLFSAIQSAVRTARRILKNPELHIAAYLYEPALHTAAGRLPSK